MKITNKKNLPLPLVKAIEGIRNAYSAGNSDITATGLIEPPRIGALKAQHRDEIEEDVCDLLYSAIGSSIHNILEKVAVDLGKEGYISEKRYFTEVSNWKLSAQIDLYHKPTSTLQDYKVTSVYSVKNGPKEEYVKQMNIQAWIMGRNGVKVGRLQIIAILRDWSKGERDRDKKEAEAKGFKSNYPEHQVAVLEVPFIPAIEVEKYITTRIQEHKDSRASLPQCTDEDRWARPTKWAVMSKGKDRAIRLCATEHEANAWLMESKNYYIEIRPGQNIRCEQYCPVARYCTQWKELKNKKTKGE